MLPPIYEFNTTDTIIENGDLNTLFENSESAPETVTDPRKERLDNYLNFQKNLVILLNRTLGYDVESRLSFNEIIKDAYAEGDEQAAAAINEMLETAGIPVRISDDLTTAQKTQNNIDSLPQVLLKKIEQYGIPIKDVTSVKVNKNESNVIESIEVYIGSDQYFFKVNDGEVRPVKIDTTIDMVKSLGSSIDPFIISDVAGIIQNMNFENYTQQLDVLYATIEDKVTDEDAASVLFNIADNLSDAFSSNDFKKICN